MTGEAPQGSAPDPEPASGSAEPASGSASASASASASTSVPVPASVSASSSPSSESASVPMPASVSASASSPSDASAASPSPAPSPEPSLAEVEHAFAQLDAVRNELAARHTPWQVAFSRVSVALLSWVAGAFGLLVLGLTDLWLIPAVAVARSPEYRRAAARLETDPEVAHVPWLPRRYALTPEGATFDVAVGGVGAGVWIVRADVRGDRVVLSLVDWGGGG